MPFRDCIPYQAFQYNQEPRSGHRCSQTSGQRPHRQGEQPPNAM